MTCERIFYFEMLKVKPNVKEEIIDVVKPISQGSANKFSLYVLVPLPLREKLNIDDQTEFVVLLAGRDIVYRKKEA